MDNETRNVLLENRKKYNEIKEELMSIKENMKEININTKQSESRHNVITEYLGYLFVILFYIVWKLHQ